MICKKDVILWFKELESYNRIDTMCALLNMCLPFELRFLGTCLEELGRRDSQELRGIELRVNNPQDLAMDMAACQKGEPTDKKIRRKMALYLALIRACNRSCVTEIFKTLDGWSRRDFSKLNDLDTLQELLLVYTMAANHPVFTFEQHMTCAQIFEKIEENRVVCNYRAQQQIKPATTLSTERHILMPHQQQLQGIHMHPGHHHHQSTPVPIQVVSQGNIPTSFQQSHMSKMIPPDGTLQHQITVDGITHMLSSNIAIPTELTIAHPNAWSLKSSMHNYTHTSVEQGQLQSVSPILSQQSSPSNSRAASPTRANACSLFQAHQQQQQTLQLRNIQRTGPQLRTVRRPSVEITSPPTVQQQQQIIGSLNNEIICSQNIKNLEEIMVSSESSMTQLQALIRNGYTRAGNHTIAKLSKSAVNLQKTSLTHPQEQHHQQQLNQHFQSITSSNLGISSSLAYTVQNMSIFERQHSQMENCMMTMTKHQQNSGSDSGSSIGSSGDISPPETPNLTANIIGLGKIKINDKHLQQPNLKHQQYHYNKQLNITRLKSRTEKLLPISVGSNISSIYPPAPSLQQHFIGNDILLSGGPNMNQSLTNNNQISVSTNDGGESIVPCSGGICANNNTVIITSPSANNVSSGGILSSVITTNSIILQQGQHQHYTVAHPYHPPHIASTNRTPIIPHSSEKAGPSLHGSFRLPSFQIPPNGDLLYPFHPTGMAFLSGTAQSLTAVAAVRSSPSTSVPSSTTANVMQPPQLLNQQQSLLSQAQTNPPASSPSLLPTLPYSSLIVGVSKQLSCYNCGSQKHNGRDCNEASMEDVTREAIYKLDYSVASSIPLTGPQTSEESLTENNIKCSNCILKSMTTTEIDAESSPTASSSSLSNSNLILK